MYRMIETRYRDNYRRFHSRPFQKLISIRRIEFQGRMPIITADRLLKAIKKYRRMKKGK